MFRLPIKNNAAPSSGWVRPTEWLALPNIVEGGDKFSALFMVNPGFNPLVFTVSGDFTIDWGDGVVANHVGGTTVTHLYNYEDFTDQLNTITRQGIVTITPQNGNILTSIVVERSSLVGFATILFDVKMSGSNINNIAFDGVDHELISFEYVGIPINLNQGFLFDTCRLLEHVIFNATNQTNMDYWFRRCERLTHLHLTNTDNVLSFANTFTECLSLEYIPEEINFDNADDLTQFLTYCSKLKALPTINPKPTVEADTYGFYQDLESLKQIPDTYTTLPLNRVHYIFRNCFALVEIPAFDFSVADQSSVSLPLSGMKSLRRIKATGIGFDLDLRRFPIAHPELVEVFTNLADLTALTSKLITITGCPGTASLTQAEKDIVLNKNWTIAE